MDVILSTGAKALHLNLQPLGQADAVETTAICRLVDHGRQFPHEMLFFESQVLWACKFYRVHRPNILHVAQDD